LPSTATAAAPQTPASASYLWSFPGSPVRIHLHLSCVERLLAEVLKTAGETPDQSTESGGILIGRAESPEKIEIVDFLPISRDESSPRYVLAPEDCRRVEQAKTALGAREGLVAIGYYRSSFRNGLRLEQEDIALLQEHFPNPSNVALLIHPTRTGSSTAGFFFWDNGILESGFSFNEFPFDPAQLRLEMEQQRSAALEQAAAAAAARRRATERKPAPSPKRKRLILPLTVVLSSLIACALGAAGYFLWSSRPRIEPAASAGGEAAISTTPLGLRVQTQSEDLRLSWNRSAPALQQNGVSAVLTILDGDLPPREIRLGQEELRTTGSIVYSPLGRTIQFRLEVLASGQKITESVLAIKGSRTAYSSVLRDGPIPSQPASATPAPNVRQTAPAAPAQPPPSVPRVFSLPQAPPKQEPSNEESWRQITLESGPVITQTSHMPATAPLALSEPLKMPPGPKPPEPAQTASRPQPPPVRAPQETKPPHVYAGPKSIQQVQPILSRQAWASITRDTAVKVKVTIGADGKVTRAQAVSKASPYLTGAAVIAAQHWRFEPATLNGQRVESDTVLTFDFRVNPVDSVGR
jgi:TonB family protein